MVGWGVMHFEQPCCWAATQRGVAMGRLGCHAFRGAMLLDGHAKRCCYGSVGDVVQAHTWRNCAAIMPHSDWNGVRNGMLCISVVVQEIGPQQAPLVMYSRTTGMKPVLANLPLGTCILRCVDTIHSGSPNLTGMLRVLPGVRAVSPL